MSWKRVAKFWSEAAEVDTSSDVDEAMPSTDDIVIRPDESRLPKPLFEALATYKRTLQAKRNALISERAHKKAAKKLGPEHVEAFLAAKKALEIAHSEWERHFESPEGETISLDDHANDWSRRVRW